MARLSRRYIEPRANHAYVFQGGTDADGEEFGWNESGIIPIDDVTGAPIDFRHLCIQDGLTKDNRINRGSIEKTWRFDKDNVPILYDPALGYQAHFASWYDDQYAV